MKKITTTYSTKYMSVNELPVYKKAIEIFSLSRELVRLLSADQNILELSRSRDRIDRISDYLLSASLGLAPRIAMVESSADPLVRLNSLKSIHQATGKLQKYCDQIESRNDQARLFLKQLRSELGQFRKLQSRWAGRVRELN
ncbi:hypothetical protein [Robertkochia flava]|uniref:hypothetical protein n=1 Tax=Robertkochia flava TaxID=3447986 RepID=UPI001CCB8EE6|nr:hypothetical protein [Robertkochia marina]